jgi:hypothetical protein
MRKTLGYLRYAEFVCVVQYEKLYTEIFYIYLKNITDLNLY